MFCSPLSFYLTASDALFAEKDTIRAGISLSLVCDVSENVTKWPEGNLSESLSQPIRKGLLDAIWV